MQSYITQSEAVRGREAVALNKKRPPFKCPLPVMLVAVLSQRHVAPQSISECPGISSLHWPFPKSVSRNARWATFCPRWAGIKRRPLEISCYSTPIGRMATLRVNRDWEFFVCTVSTQCPLLLPRLWSKSIARFRGCEAARLRLDDSFISYTSTTPHFLLLLNVSNAISLLSLESVFH